MLLNQHDETVFYLAAVEVGSFVKCAESLATVAGEDGKDALRSQSATHRREAAEPKWKERWQTRKVRSPGRRCVPANTYCSEFAVLVLNKTFAKLGQYLHMLLFIPRCFCGTNVLPASLVAHKTWSL
jgi:hypothetical protein